MPSTPLSKLRLLPAAWEIALFPAPVQADGVDLRAAVIVAEVDTRQVRMLAPVPVGASLLEVLRGAFTSPAAPTRPGRPSGVRAATPELLAELRPLLREAGVLGAVSDDLPAVTEAIASLLVSMGGPVAPGLTNELPLWRAALRELALMAPWRKLHDDVHFLVPAPDGGEPAVAVIIGGRGEHRGIVRYPTIRALDEHYAVMGTGALGPVDMGALLMEPGAELSADERAACTRAALVFPTSEPRAGPLHAKAYVIRAGSIRPPEPDEQRALLRAVQAVVAVCRSGLAGLAAGAVMELGGVRAGRGTRPDGAHSPGDIPPFFCGVDMRVVFSLSASPDPSRPPMPNLVFKMGKAHALAIAPFFESVRAVRLLSAGNWKVGVADLRDGSSWAITDRMEGEAGELLVRYFRGPELGLLVASGGPSRPQWQMKDVVASVVVPVLEGRVGSDRR